MDKVQIIDSLIKDEVEAIDQYSKNLSAFNVNEKADICRIIEEERNHIRTLEFMKENIAHEKEREERKRLFGSI